MRLDILVFRLIFVLDRKKYIKIHQRFLSTSSNPLHLRGILLPWLRAQEQLKLSVKYLSVEHTNSVDCFPG